MSESSLENPPSKPKGWSRLAAPIAATLLVLGMFLPSIPSLKGFIVLITIAIVPLALTASGIRSGSVKTEKTGWALFGINMVMSMLIILG